MHAEVASRKWDHVWWMDRTAPGERLCCHAENELNEQCPVVSSSLKGLVHLSSPNTSSHVPDVPDTIKC